MIIKRSILESIKELIGSCCEFDPNQRPSFEQICQILNQFSSNDAGQGNNNLTTINKSAATIENPEPQYNVLQEVKDNHDNHVDSTNQYNVFQEEKQF